MIEQHLQELLYTKGSFNIPGLCFVKGSKISSSYNESSGIYSPPSKSFELEEALEKDDEFLILEVAKTKSNKAEGKLAVEKFVQRVNQELLEKGESVISGVGVITKTESKMSLEIAEGVNFREEVYGMKSFYVKPLAEKKETVGVVPVSKEVETKEIEKVKPSIEEETAKEKNTVSTEEVHPEKKKSVVALILVPFIFVVVLAGSVYGVLTYGPELADYASNLMSGEEVMTHSDESSDTELHENTTASDSEDEISDHDHDTSVEEGHTATEFADNEIKAINELSERFHIVAGAFSIEANARKFASSLPNAVIVNDGRLNLVLIGNYYSEEEARSELSHFKSSVGNEVWLKIR